MLIGILTPALAGVRAAGHRAVCASNIRQLQLANDLHAHDHDDRFVAGAIDLDGANLHRWHGKRESIWDAFNPVRGDITPYLDGSDLSRGIRACPSFLHTLSDRPERPDGFETDSGGYGYNNAFVGAERRLSRFNNWVVETRAFGSKRSKFASPSSTVAFADAALAEYELIEYSFVEPNRWPHRPRFQPDPSTHFRHSEQANVVWLDGHVGPERMTFTQTFGAYLLSPEEFGIGWFGKYDDNRLFDYE